MICSKGGTKGPHQKYAAFVFTSDWQFHSWNSIKPSHFMANPNAKLTPRNSEKHLEALFSVVSLKSCWLGYLTYTTVLWGSLSHGTALVGISVTCHSVGGDLCHTPQCCGNSVTRHSVVGTLSHATVLWGYLSHTTVAFWKSASSISSSITHISQLLHWYLGSWLQGVDQALA